VTIESTDRTAYIDWPSFTIENILNNQVDTCSFVTKKYGDRTWKPRAGDEIEITDGLSTIFAGVIIEVEEETDALLIRYRVECKDWTHYLDRSLVVESYKDKTVNEIIDHINDNYLSGFTITNVDCDIFVTSITFNRIPVSQCLQILAEKTNYSWYIDYDKDIHFFAKNSETSPFDLTDENGKYIFSSLKITEDISQIRNKIYVRGGEAEATSRDDNFVGDGTKKTFALSYKFASKPTVTVGGASKTVGIDFLDTSGYDCYWNYNEKYIRFDTAPASSAAIVVSGNPLYPILIQVQDDVSIAEYGTYEFSLIDKAIKSNDEARLYGYSQLTAYANNIKEGSFQTYESGLRSGQAINIQSTVRGTNESFLIQRVNLQMRGPNDGLWTVELATLRTLGIIDFLQKLLMAYDRMGAIAESEIVTLEMSRTDQQTVDVTESITKKTPNADTQTANCTESISKDPLGAGVAPDWVLAPYVPSGHTDTKREMLLDYSSYLY